MMCSDRLKQQKTSNRGTKTRVSPSGDRNVEQSLGVGLGQGAGRVEREREWGEGGGWGGGGGGELSRHFTTQPFEEVLMMADLVVVGRFDGFGRTPFYASNPP